MDLKAVVIESKIRKDFVTIKTKNRESNCVTSGYFIVTLHIIMESLGSTDIVQLYNYEKREMIKKMMDASSLTARVLKQGGASQDVIDIWEMQSNRTMYYCLRKLKEKYYGSTNDNHTWIGIDPSGQTMQELWDKTHELCDKYCFTKGEDMAFNVEQNTRNGVRPHIHLMIRGVIKQRPAYIAKRLAEFYSCAPNFIEVKHFRRKQMFTEHLNYIKGIKSEAKMPDVQLDIKDRNNLGIPDFKLFS